MTTESNDKQWVRKSLTTYPGRRGSKNLRQRINHRTPDKTAKSYLTSISPIENTSWQRSELMEQSETTRNQMPHNNARRQW